MKTGVDEPDFLRGFYGTILDQRCQHSPGCITNKMDTLISYSFFVSRAKMTPMQAGR